MSDLSIISDIELTQRYWTSRRNIDTWQRLLPYVNNERARTQFQERIDSNQRIMDAAAAEMRRRGLTSSSL